MATSCLWKQKKPREAIASTLTADTTPTPALVLVERLDFEARLVVGGEPVPGELLAVADWFEEDVGIKMPR